MEAKYNFVYETKNHVNGKIYRGVHCTENLQDGYLGSGKLLLFAIKKYGRSNFSRVILEFSDTREKVYKLEENYIDTNFVNRSDTYNLICGGRMPDIVAIRKSLKENDHQQGATNSQFDTMWITDGKENIKIGKSSTIPTGFRKGRKLVEKTVWEKRIEDNHSKKEKEILERIDSLKNIDFTVKGWSNRVGALWGISRVAAWKWMKRYCPELLLN